MTWPKIEGADGYDIYVSVCGKKFKGVTASVTGNQNRSVMRAPIKKVAGKKLKRNKIYKMQVRAYRMTGGEKEYIADGAILHVVSDKNPVYTNAKKVRVSKKKYSIKAGNTSRIRASVIKRLLPEGHGPKLSYVSSNKSVANVSRNGKITAKRKGTCTIYVRALNGQSEKITVKVR